MRLLATATTLLVLLQHSRVQAVTVDQVDATRDWRLGRLELRGVGVLLARDLRSGLATQPRRWFALWRPYPPFEPGAFRDDLERLGRRLRARGYYKPRVDGDVEIPAEGNVVDAVVTIDPGPRVVVGEVALRFTDDPPPAAEQARLLRALPLSRGAPFTQEDYEAGQATLRAHFREQGHAMVNVTRGARVDLDLQEASVDYTITPGSLAVFGEVTIEGTRNVDPDVLRREVAFDPGDPFRAKRLEETRARLVGLNLLGNVRIEEDTSHPPVVGIRIVVTELPHRDVRFGLGYDSEEGPRAIAGWRDYDFFGDGRQLGFTARISQIHRTIIADFLQPHWPLAESRVRLLFAEQQEDEETYTLDRIRVGPRFEWQAAPELMLYALYRIEYDSLSDVDLNVEQAIPGAVPSNALLSGLGFGADVQIVDDRIDPTRGFVFNLTVEPVGGVLGGEIGFTRVVTEGRGYFPIWGPVFGAVRGRLGSMEPLDGSDDIPVYERFYAGGLYSVRGYERRHVGPLTRRGDEPLGGRSLVDGSLELRYHVSRSLTAATFLDAGQVSLETFDFPLDDLRYGAGLGLIYRSPIGPLRVDLGFPVDRPRGDAGWQLHFSVGQVF